jgi:hypothetical protein
MAVIQGRTALTIALADIVDDQLATISPNPYWIRDPVEGEVEHPTIYPGVKWQILVVRTKFRGVYIRIPFKGFENENRRTDDRDSVELLAFVMWSQLSGYPSRLFDDCPI